LVLTANDLEVLLSGGYERRHLEVKGPGERDDKHFFAKVTRAILSMANLRDGGHVVLGIVDTDLVAMLPGLAPPQVASWLDFDTVSARIATYTDPPLRFDLSQLHLSSGAAVVVIEVHEFDDVPILCAQGFQAQGSQEVLRKGACYVRSHRIPETAEIPTAVEMRELLDLAIEKRLRRFLATAQVAGGVVQSAETASSLFDAQAGEAW
jgi:hypothetical protein